MPRRALIVIDVQNDYFPGGVWALPDAETALPNILRLIDAARGRGEQVVFIQHATPPDGPVFAKGSPGWTFHASLPVSAGDPVFEKNHPSAFQGTGLVDWLRNNDIQTMDICGFMTQMCCDSTTREAYGRGYAVRLFTDACAAREVTLDGVTTPHDVVHRTHLGSLARFAELRNTEEAE